MLSSSIRNNRLLSLSLLRRIQQQSQCRGLSSSSNNMLLQQQQKLKGKNIIATGAAAFLVVAAATTTTTFLEEKKETTVDDNNNIEIDYENLPEDDEETECSICKTNRKGPCRQFWRKAEYCMKNNEGEVVAEKCVDYMLPWIECLQKHPNLYTLLNNQVTQREYVDIYETNLYWNTGNAPHEEWEVNIDNDIDWTELWSSSTDENSDKESNTTNTTNTTTIDQYHPDAMAKNLKTDGDWANFFLRLKTTDIDYYENKKQKDNNIMEKEDIIYDANTYEGEPNLVQVGVRIPLFLSDRNATLEMCYVRDQNGRLLGMDQFNSLFKENNLSPQHEEVLKFYIEPGKTTSLRFYKVYQSPVPKKEEDKTEDKPNNNEEMAVLDNDTTTTADDTKEDNIATTTADDKKEDYDTTTTADDKKEDNIATTTADDKKEDNTTTTTADEKDDKKEDNDTTTTADEKDDKKEDKPNNNQEMAVYHTFVSKPIHIIQAAYHYEKQKQQQESSST